MPSCPSVMRLHFLSSAVVEEKGTMWHTSLCQLRTEWSFTSAPLNTSIAPGQPRLVTRSKNLLFILPGMVTPPLLTVPYIAVSSLLYGTLAWICFHIQICIYGMQWIRIQNKTLTLGLISGKAALQIECLSQGFIIKRRTSRNWDWNSEVSVS